MQKISFTPSIAVRIPGLQPTPGRSRAPDGNTGLHDLLFGERSADAFVRTSADQVQTAASGRGKARPVQAKPSWSVGGRSAIPRKSVLLGALLAAARFIGAGADPRAAALRQTTPLVTQPFPLPQCPQPLREDGAFADSAQVNTRHRTNYQPFVLPGHVPAWPADAGARYFDVQPLRQEYAGEHELDKVWPGQVDYLADAQERAPYLVKFDRGRMFDAGGQPIDTRNAPGGEAIFVMSPQDGRIYLSTTPRIGKFHHSSFLAGDVIAAGGTMEVVDGQLRRATPLTGHYRTLPEQMDQLARELDRQGVTGYELHRTPPPARLSTLQWLQNIVTLTCSTVLIGSQVMDKIHARKLRNQLAQIDGKLGQLSPDALALLRIAALEGRRFRSETARAVMNRDEAALAIPTQELARVLGADATGNGLVLVRVQQQIPQAERESLERALIPGRLAGLSADELKLARVFALSGGKLARETALGVMAPRGEDEIARMTRGLLDDVFGKDATRYRLTTDAILENISKTQRGKLETAIKKHSPREAST